MIGTRSTMTDPAKTYDEPLQVEIHGNEVVIFGPGPNGIALTARAAAISATRLAEAACQAGHADARAPSQDASFDA